MNKLEQIPVIENFLRVKYQTDFTVTIDDFGYIINPSNFQDFAKSIEMDVESDEFYNFITDLERAVALIF